MGGLRAPLYERKNMGAVTFPLGVSKESQGIINDKRSVRVLCVPSTSYATGGDTVPLGTLGLKTLDKVLVDANANNTSGLTQRLAGTPNVPLLQFYDAADTEVANGSNNSARAFVGLFLGT